MAKPKKLKVFRTPIGFHDAYVAAPSQKAALEAWGAESNLFAQGVAEQVSDPELMKAPLEHPGEVIKRMRGTTEEQIAALGTGNPNATERKSSPRRSRASSKGAKPKPPKPSRAEVDRLEQALADLEKRHRAEAREVEQELERLERRRRELQRRHEAEHDELASERDRAVAEHERALRRWDKQY